MSSLYRRGRAEIHANLTPMIDVTFLLIVFFVLVSQIVEVESVELSLPELTEPLTELPGDEQRAVINVVPGARGQAAEYRLGARGIPAGPEGQAQLEARLVVLMQANPALRINLRADRNTEYRAVQPVLKAISAAAGRASEAGARPRVNLVVVRED